LLQRSIGPLDCHIETADLIGWLQVERRQVARAESRKGTTECQSLLQKSRLKRRLEPM
jgi:hypothetical protein